MSREELRVFIMAKRRERGLSQMALANRAGISQAAYARFENNQTGFHVHTLVAVLAALGLKLDVVEA